LEKNTFHLLVSQSDTEREETIAAHNSVLGRNNKDRKKQGVGGQAIKPKNKEKTLVASLKHLPSKA